MKCAWVSECGNFRLVHWWDEKGEPHARMDERRTATRSCRPSASACTRGPRTAEQPGVTWGKIVREFLDAHKSWKEGNRVPMVQWVNETKGETYEDEGDKADVNALQTRAKEAATSRGTVPWGCLILAAGVDVQDDRFEITVWGAGRGEEMWAIDYIVLDANPALASDWDRLWDHLQLQYRHVSARGSASPAPQWTPAATSRTRPTSSWRSTALQSEFPALRDEGQQRRRATDQGAQAKWMDINDKGRTTRRASSCGWSAPTRRRICSTAAQGHAAWARLRALREGPAAEFFEQFGNEKRMPYTVNGKTKFRWVHCAAATRSTRWWVPIFVIRGVERRQVR
jgi:hypothetical protein